MPTELIVALTAGGLSLVATILPVVARGRVARHND